MTVVSQKIPNLIGGVSQQPDSLKLPGQLRECTNFLLDPTFGMVKRPGFRGIQRLENTTTDGSWFTLFKSDEDKYIVQIRKNGQFRVWDADSGTEQTVNAVTDSAATAYATHTDKSQIELLQINDFTFVLNRAITTRQSNDKSPAQTPYAYVVINVVGYDNTYRVTLDGTNFVYTSPAATSSSVQPAGTDYAVVVVTNNNVSIDTIRTGLLSLINGSGTYVATGVGNVIRIRRSNNADFRIEAAGGTVGDGLEAIKNSVLSIAQLPRQAFNGDKIQVTTPEVEGTGYWLQFKTSDSSTAGIGVWEETIKPDEFTSLDLTTMPHVLVREANGTFTYRRFSEANASATTTSASVAGAANSVSVTTDSKGRYVTGQTFPVYGGTGINLRLRVTRTKTVTTTTTSTLPSNTRVRWLSFQGGRQEYQWFVNGILIRNASTDQGFTIGEVTYSVGGAWQNVTPIQDPAAVQEQEAPITQVTKRSGVVDLVEPSRRGRGYTASDVVTNLEGDTFTINTVATVTNDVESFAKFFWVQREVGDSKSNPFPSFLNRPISGMSFFLNRLVLMSDENVICSRAGDYFNLFNESVAVFIESDPVDLSCGSRTPLQLRHAVPTSRGLMIFADNAQYVLETRTDAFSAASAEINLITSYSQSPRIAPIDSGPTVMFLEESDRSVMLFEMLPSAEERGERLKPVELTRLIPDYIPADIRQMVGSQTSGVVALTTRREPQSIYMYRFFSNANQQVMASWFKWSLPENVSVDMVDFYHETMYAVLRGDGGSVLCKVNFITDSPSGAIFFENKLLDIKLDYFDYNPTTTYDSVNDRTTVMFKPGFHVDGAQPVVVTTSPENQGFTVEPEMETDGTNFFVKVPGNFSNSGLALGYKYVSEALMPLFYLKSGEDGRADTVNIPTIHRIQIDSFESGPFRIKVESVGRGVFEQEIPQRLANQIPANTLPMRRAAKNTFPVLAKGDLVDVTILADSPFPTSFNSVVWEGTYNTKGVRVT
jgi:hypothetical protein